MTQVNLLPPDVRERARTRRTTAAVIAVGAAAVVLLLLLYLVQVARLSGADRDLAAQQNVNNGLQARIADLQQFQDIQQELANRQGLVAGLEQGEVLWSGVLRDVSLVIPGQMWLTSMTGNITAVAGAAPGGAVAPTQGNLIGTIQFQGTSFDHPTVALWLQRLEQVTGWVNSWVTNSTKAEAAEGGRSLVDFSGSVDLSSRVGRGGAP